MARSFRHNPGGNLYSSRVYYLADKYFTRYINRRIRYYGKHFSQDIAEAKYEYWRKQLSSYTGDWWADSWSNYGTPRYLTRPDWMRK
jgi:hypothetical protein